MLRAIKGPTTVASETGLKPLVQGDKGPRYASGDARTTCFPVYSPVWGECVPSGARAQVQLQSTE